MFVPLTCRMSCFTSRTGVHRPCQRLLSAAPKPWRSLSLPTVVWNPVRVNIIAQPSPLSCNLGHVRMAPTDTVNVRTKKIIYNTRSPPTISPSCFGASTMLFSRNGLIRVNHPLHAASRVVTASASATSIVARCWVHSTNRTSALIRSVRNGGLRRAYATKATNSAGDDPNQGIPFYSTFTRCFLAAVAINRLTQESSSTLGTEHRPSGTQFR